jgi:hypothetical protein
MVTLVCERGHGAASCRRKDGCDRCWLCVAKRGNVYPVPSAYGRLTERSPARPRVLLATTLLEDGGIVFATFENTLYRTPYLVALDHPRRAVVVAVRGTLSLGDALVDMQVHEVCGSPRETERERECVCVCVCV